MELKNNDLGPNERLLIRVNKIKEIRDKILSSTLTIEEETMVLNAILEELDNISLMYSRNMNNKELLEQDGILNDYHEVPIDTSGLAIDGDSSLREPKVENIMLLDKLITKVLTLEDLTIEEKKLLEEIIRKYQMNIKELLSAKKNADLEFQNVFGYSYLDDTNKKNSK